MRNLILVLGLLIHGCGAHASIDTKATEALKWEDVKLADAISDVGLTAMYVYPVVLTLNEDDIGSRLLTLGTSHLLTAGVTKVVKVWAGRERPNHEDFRSFFSGHSSAAFTSAGYICRYEKKHCAPALMIAGSVGYLRIAATKHWLSDVLVGASLGFISGHAIPIYTKGF